MCNRLFPTASLLKHLCVTVQKVYFDEQEDENKPDSFTWLGLGKKCSRNAPFLELPNPTNISHPSNPATIPPLLVVHTDGVALLLHAVGFLLLGRQAS